MRLNIEDWKEFYVGNIFKKVKIKKYSAIPESEGETPFISSTSVNNGVSTKVDEKPINGNCITVSTNGDCFDVFYQREPVVVSSDVEVLYLDKLNEINAMFLCTVLRQEKFKYSYGRKPKSNKVFDTLIKLPICRDENNEPIIDSSKKYSEDGYIPDFKWMENYIKTLNHKPLTTSNGGGRGKNKLQLDVERWGEFEVVKLFNGYKRGTRITTSDRLSGNYPFVTAGEQNEGVAEKINNIEAITYNNAITIDMFGNSFYHGYDFKADDNILVLKNKTFLNKYIGCFISTVINQDKYKNSYGRQYRQKDCDIHVIKLPICYGEDGETPVIDTTHKYSKEGYIPDFKFMEEYIKSLPYGDRI